MMIRIQQLKLKPDHTELELKKKIKKALRLKEEETFQYEIVKQSIDGRRKPDIFYVYTVDVSCNGEEKKFKSLHDKNITIVQKKSYVFPEHQRTAASAAMTLPPVIAGTGPAGLFCGLMLARAGYRPILLERGEAVEERQDSVDRFWNEGILDPDSNVQFGEGGAGTFSDGKLNTAVKDEKGRIQFVLKTFIEAGADPDICYVNKPHIGTDVLRGVVKQIREEIISLGGTIYFNHQLMDFEAFQPDQSLTGSSVSTEDTDKTENAAPCYHLRIRNIKKEKQNKNSTTLQDPESSASSVMELDTQILILAIGHSARDTFSMLLEHNCSMQPKSFAVGVRVEHPQTWIDQAMYGKNSPYEMPPAPYKLTHRCQDGRGVYSFCMCPGGYVVNASSEPERLAVNGMSYRSRSGENANSAIVVTVSVEDYGGTEALDGLHFQQKLEAAAYQAGNGKIPVQRFEDFVNNKSTQKLGTIKPQMKGAYQPGNVRAIFPAQIQAAIEEGITAFERQIPGFSNPDALLSGVESRTSSPVRINRDEAFESNVSGIYPCGEGAGYAGGITSAAIDGIRVAEAVAKKFFIDFLKK